MTTRHDLELGAGQRSRLPRPTTAAPDLVSYRDAVANLQHDLAPRGGDPVGAEAMLAERLADPRFAAVLDGTPRGLAGTVDRLREEVRRYRPCARSSAADLGAQVRIFLLAQIEAMWWGHVPPYETATDVCGAADLIDLEVLRRAGRLPFRYRRQPRTLARRAVRAVERRVAPDRTPRTAGLRFTHTRPETVALLGQVCTEFAEHGPAGAPPLWVTSMTRSVSHQRHLRDLGYAAMEPSSHCVGWAVDVEMAWFGRHGAREALEEVLLSRQAAGDVNVIDEGQAWHVCVSPDAVAALRREFTDHYAEA